MKKIRYFFEALAVYILFAIFWCLPAKAASNLGGWLGRTIGSILAMNRRVKRHLKMVFPDIKKEEQEKVTKEMWENLGRIFAEYPHLEKISKNAEIKNLEKLEPYLNQNKPIIFIGAHIGNWEINGMAMLSQLNKSVALTYRPPNNPWVDRLLQKLRTLNGRIEAYPKSSEGGRNMMKILKQNGRLGILIDQKYNEGIITEFFGHPAMTNPVFVQLAQKYDCPIIPVRCERIHKTDFKLTVYDDIKTKDQNGNLLQVEDVVKQAQALIEDWIKERPEQWIWLHRRWGKAKYARSQRKKNNS